MRLLIDSQNVTHVLIQHDERVLLQWEPNMRTEEMVAWLARQPGLNEITLSTPHMRLFETSHSIERYERPFHTTVVPASTPLITDWRHASTAGRIDPMFLKTPWAVEGGSSGGHLWMGQGRAGGPRPWSLVAPGARRRSAVRCHCRAEPHGSGSHGHAAAERCSGWRSKVSGHCGPRVSRDAACRPESGRIRRP